MTESRAKVKFDEFKKCFTDARGRKIKGSTRFYKRSDYNTYGCQKAKELGTKVMKDVELHVKEGKRLKTPGGKRIIDYLRFRGITPIKAEFPVTSQRCSVTAATAVDLVCEKDGNRHYLIEIKCTPAPMKVWFDKIAHAIDEKIPRKFYRHFQQWKDHTRWNSYVDQALCNMDCYANTLKKDVFSPGDVVSGALLILFEADKPEEETTGESTLHWEEFHNVVYRPDTGANTIREDIRVKREERAKEKAAGKCPKGGVQKKKQLPTLKVSIAKGAVLVQPRKKQTKKL